MELKRFFTPTKLRLLLALVVLVAFIPGLGLVLYTGLSYRDFVVESIRNDALQSTESSAGLVDDVVESTRVLLAALAHSEEVQSGDAARIDRYFAELVDDLPQYANLGATHTDGTVFASGVPLAQPINVADFDYFRRVLATGDFAGGDYQVGRITGKAILIFSYPVFGPDGRIQNVLFASLDLGYIADVATSTPLPENAVINMIDRNGTILVRYPDLENLRGQTLPEDQLVNTMLGASEGMVEMAGLDGASRIYSFTTVRGTGDNIRLTIGIPRGSAYATANRILVSNLLLLGLIALLALGGAAFFSELFILRRMRRLVAATDRLAAGDLSARTGISGTSGELGRLAVSFDAMAESLERRNAELEEYARKLQDFLDIAGHELRHPVAIIFGYMQTLPELGETISAEQFGQIGDALRTSAQRLSAIVDDLLDVSRLESDRFPMRERAVDVEALLRDAVEEMRSKGADREFILRVAQDIPAIHADPERLHQVLIILLDNASSYTPPDSPVELSAEMEAGRIRICCLDRGPGIPEDARERIFERFGQVADVDHHGPGGLGVGLYIARRIAEAHGGSLWYEPREGGGSCFCLSLPGKMVAPPS